MRWVRTRVLYVYESGRVLASTYAIIGVRRRWASLRASKNCACTRARPPACLPRSTVRVHRMQNSFSSAPDGRELRSAPPQIICDCGALCVISGAPRMIVVHQQQRRGVRDRVSHLHHRAIRASDHAYIVVGRTGRRMQLLTLCVQTRNIKFLICAAISASNRCGCCCCSGCRCSGFDAK